MTTILKHRKLNFLEKANESAVEQSALDRGSGSHLGCGCTLLMWTLTGREENQADWTLTANRRDYMRAEGCASGTERL